LIILVLSIRESKREPIEITVSASLRELTIDDLIEEAELVIVGAVDTVLPSKWKTADGKIPNNFTAREIIESDLSIFTDTLISINQIIKGNYDETIVRVRSFVGEVDQVRFVSSDEPTYEQGQVYLLFLRRDFGPTQIVDPGDYIPVNAIDGVYKVVNGNAISVDDEWIFDELVAYVKDSPLSTSTINIPDTPESQEVIQKIETAYDIEAEAAYSFNTEKFSSVFFNDPRYEISPEEIEFIREFTHDPSLVTAGYLDYKIAYYNWWKDSALRYQALKEKAKAENREITQNEIKPFIDSKWGMAPAQEESPIREISLRFISVNVKDDMAIVYLDDGIRIINLAVVLIDNQWYIAGEKRVSLFP